MKKKNKYTCGMRRRLMVMLACCLLGMPLRFYGQPQPEKPARILFLLDASSSMLSEWQPGEQRFRAAARIISGIVDSIHAVNRDVAFAVRAFGSQYPAQDKNCFDSRLEVVFNLANEDQIRARLQYLTPKGFSPIAWSLKETAEHDFTDSRHYAYSIILITDGGESCGGDICATVTSLLSKKISFRPYILSLVDYEPLRQQYDCLGKYLTVAKEKDIIPAIRTIIEDNRKVLTIKTSGIRTVPSVVPAPAQAIRTPPPARTVPVPEKKEVPVPKTEVRVPEPEKKPAAPLVMMPKVALFDRIASLRQPSRMNLLMVLPEGSPLVVPRLSPTHLPVETGPAPVTSRPPPRVLPATPATAGTAPPKPRPAIVEPTASTVPSKSTVKRPRTPEKKTEDKLEFTEQTEEAKESSLQVYFTNGWGKFYATEPRMQIRDSKTGKVVREQYRNVTAGQPDPLKIEPGTYDVILPGSKSKVIGVVVEPGKNKKCYITVGAGSLAFYYPAAPDRPVKYIALVSKRFEPGPVVKQKCEEELPYEPANYHIEVQTLPVKVFNVDLDFNTVKLISIDEPGTVQVANAQAVGKVQFWHQLGDAYVPFYEMMVNGDGSALKADFLPGLYQLRYFKGRGGPLDKAEVIPFRIKSNMTTILAPEK